MAVIKNVLESESEDFVDEVRRAGRSLDEFDIEAKPEQRMEADVAGFQPSNAISPLAGSIRIRNNQTGAERCYRTGFGSTWVMDVIEDIRAGEL